MDRRMKVRKNNFIEIVDRIVLDVALT